MIRDFTEHALVRLTFRQHSRRGTSLLDLMVSFALLVALVSVTTPLVVRHGWLLKSHRNYRLALDELSNQMDRLVGVPADQLPGAVERLAPSEFVAERLSGTKLIGQIKPGRIGQRLTLELSWNEPGRRERPVTLAAWIIPTPPRTRISPEKDQL